MIISYPKWNYVPIEACGVLDIHEEGHAKNSENEHDQEEQKANIEQSRHGHGQGKKRGPDPTGAFDQT